MAAHGKAVVNSLRACYCWGMRGLRNPSVLRTPNRETRSMKLQRLFFSLSLALIAALVFLTGCGPI